MNTKTHYRAAVGAFIVDKNGNLLVILKHGYQNKWNIVKGGIESGETEREALKREINEELGDFDYKVISKSKISNIFTTEPDVDGCIGQARNNYWVLTDNKVVLKVPNSEIERYTWIKMTPKQIEHYFNIHDEFGTLRKYLPLEWKEIKKII